MTLYSCLTVANMLGNFSIALTYDLFITLGLITAVPVSAGTLETFGDRVRSQSLPLNNRLMRSLRSIGCCPVRSPFRGHETGRDDLHSGRFLPRNVPGQLAGLHNQATSVCYFRYIS